MTDVDTDQTAGSPLAGEDLPHYTVAERSLLGSMMISADVLADMTQRLKPDDFYEARHVTLFATMTSMFAANTPVDPGTLTTALIDSGDIVRTGGAAYLADLTRWAAVGSAGHHATTIYDAATDRRLIAFGAKLVADGRQPGNTADRLNAATAALDEITAVRGRSSGQWARDLITPTIEHIEAAGSHVLTGRIVPTGFADLDRLLGGGLADGQLIVVAARPGLGKSTVSLDFCRNVAIRSHLTAAFITLEMSALELMMRAVSAETGIPLHHIRTGSLRAEEWDRIVDVIPSIDEAPLMVFDDPGMTMPQIRAEARRLKARHGLRLLVVDYLQLMASLGRVESRQQFVADLSRSLKLLAKEVGCPVIGVSQLNRGPEQRADKKPGLGDLRESGAIEQDADVVLLLHDPSDGDPEAPRAGEMDFIIAKHRNGPTGTITVANRQHVAQFADLQMV